MTNPRCIFCNGLIGQEGRCLMCSRTQDIEYEQKVKEKQAKHNIIRRTYWGDYKTRKRGKKKKEEE